MADAQTQSQHDQSNQANQHQPAQTNDAPGTMPGDRGDAKAEPSGYRGENPGTAGQGQTHVQSNTPDNAIGQLDPSSPGETGTTPGSNTRY